MWVILQIRPQDYLAIANKFQQNSEASVKLYGWVFGEGKVGGRGRAGGWVGGWVGVESYRLIQKTKEFYYSTVKFTVTSVKFST